MFYPTVSGPANQAYKISKGLEERGYRSPVFCTTIGAEGRPKHEWMKGIEVHRFSIINISFLEYPFAPSMINGIRKENFDIIHVHGWRNFASDAGFLIAKLQKRPVILHGHGSFLGYQRMLKRKYWKSYELYDFLTFKTVAKKADIVIVSSRQEFEEAVKFGIDKSKIRIIPVGIEFNEYTKIKKEGDTIRILFVGRIARNRNVEQILYSFKEVIHDHKDVELYIVGGEERRSYTEKKGYLSELKTLSKKLEIHKKVVFTGPLYGDDLKKVYASSDLFMYTSLYENFGQTILEAAAAGLPIISTPVGVANAIVINDKTGYLIEFNNADELASKLNKLLDDTEKRIKMRENIRTIVKKEYSWDRIIEAYMQMYEVLSK